MPIVYDSLLWMGYTASRLGDMRRAVTLLAVAEEVRAFEPWFLDLVREVHEQAETQLGPEEFESCRKAGKAMSLDQAATYALEWLEERRR